MIDYQPLFDQIEQSAKPELAGHFKNLINKRLQPGQNSDLPQWQAAIEGLPHIIPVSPKFNLPQVTLCTEPEPASAIQLEIKEKLITLHPWRKGPFNLFGIEIDAEWRSDKKWERLNTAIDLRGKRLLDIGCGNGYYGYRMLGAGAQMVLGIEPFLKNVYQYFAVARLAGKHPFYVLPLGIEDLPTPWEWFDTVFSMGVFYHRRSPFDHLALLKSFLRPGGQLVLETLVIEGNAGEVLVPPGRYAKMRNVWFIPAPETLLAWLQRAGFKQVQLLDVTTTTVEEQRPTEWMRFESLLDFLDKNNPQLTIEGLPAPRRALFTATK